MKNIVKLLLVAVCIISCSIQSKQETPKKFMKQRGWN